MAAVLPYVPVAFDAAKSVGARALAYARRYYPKVAQEATSVFSASDKSIDNSANSKSPKTQAFVIDNLLKAGLPAATFVADHQLTAEEASMYAQLIIKHQIAQAQAVDHNQTAKISSGNPNLDATTTDLEIEQICTRLGIDSDFYALLVRGVNTHTTADIEHMQLERARRGQKKI